MKFPFWIVIKKNMQVQLVVLIIEFTSTEEI